MSFRDIKGQDKSIQILKSYIKQDRLKGGYLFIGPDGVGKKLIAKTLAKAVNCIENSSDSCDTCVSCLKIENNQHPDVHILDTSMLLSVDLQDSSGETGSSDAIKIGHIRQLQKDINLKPYEARMKVFIIDNAHNLTAPASNALLKILEEPPDDSLIILISDKPALLFKTIISRCKIFKFSLLKRIELKEILKKDYLLDNNTAHFLAYFSEGRLGCALSLNGPDILSQKNSIIDQIVFSRRANIDSLSIQNRDTLRRYLNILAAYFRDIYLLKIGIPHSEVINFDRKDDLLKIMSHFSFLDLDDILNSISNSILYLEQNINVKLLLYNLIAEIWKV